MAKFSKFTLDSVAAANNFDLYYAPDYLYDSEGVANIAYCCRMCNGDVSSGDGYKYRGRGIVQLTGKCNYTGFDEWYNNKYDPDIDILNNPDVVANNTNLAILSGMWFFKENVLDRLEEDEMTLFNVSRMINRPGATRKEQIRGYNDRENRYNEAQQEINCN